MTVKGRVEPSSLQNADWRGVDRGEDLQSQATD